MPNDDNFWKKQYQDTWDESSSREERLKKYLEKVTDYKCELIGLGAGKTDFISGNAKSNGHDKGDADLHVIGTNIYIEVTGPLSKNVRPSEQSPMWFRPDKIENAICHRERNEFLAHNYSYDNSWRFIRINNDFIHRYQNQEFRIVNPKIRGAIETYVEVPIDYKRIGTLEQFIEYLRKYDG